MTSTLFTIGFTQKTAEEFFRLLKMHGSPGHVARHHPIREPRNPVRLKSQGGNAHQQSREHSRSGGIAANTDDDLRLEFREHRAARENCARNVSQRLQAYRRGGFVMFRDLPEMPEPLPAFPGGRFEQFRRAMAAENIRNVTAVSLQTREHNFGVILFPHAERHLFGASNLRLLIGLALQIGLTLENYVVMHDAQRRTKEYQLLTQIDTLRDACGSFR